MMYAYNLQGECFNAGFLFSYVYFMLFGVKDMMTCVSSKEVLYGVSIVVHSSFGMVRMVIVFWFSFAARRA